MPVRLPLRTISVLQISESLCPVLLAVTMRSQFITANAMTGGMLDVAADINWLELFVWTVRQFSIHVLSKVVDIESNDVETMLYQ